MTRGAHSLLERVGRMHPSPLRGDHEAIGEDLPAFCANPACRMEFRRNAWSEQDGTYCSERCHADAQRDHRRAVARLQHFEALVEQLRHDVAAFGLPLDPPRHRAADDS